MGYEQNLFFNHSLYFDLSFCSINNVGNTMYSEGENTEIKLLLLLHPFQNCGESSGGTPLTGLYWDVPVDRVWFSSSLS